MLTTADRCDRCGAQAYMVAFFETGLLTFCAHHGRMYMAVIVEIATEVYDLSDSIVTNIKTRLL